MELVWYERHRAQAISMRAAGVTATGAQRVMGWATVMRAPLTVVSPLCFDASWSMPRLGSRRESGLAVECSARERSAGREGITPGWRRSVR
jgi:hypothetical protein